MLLQQREACAPGRQRSEIRTPYIDGAQSGGDGGRRSCSVAEEVLRTVDGGLILGGETLARDPFLQLRELPRAHGHKEPMDVVEPHQPVGAPVACPVQCRDEQRVHRRGTARQPGMFRQRPRACEQLLQAEEPRIAMSIADAPMDVDVVVDAASVDPGVPTLMGHQAAIRCPARPVAERRRDRVQNRQLGLLHQDVGIVAGPQVRARIVAEGEGAALEDQHLDAGVVQPAEQSLGFGDANDVRRRLVSREHGQRVPETVASVAGTVDAEPPMNERQDTVAERGYRHVSRVGQLGRRDSLAAYQPGEQRHHGELVAGSEAGAGGAHGIPGMLVGMRCMAEIIGQKSAVYRDTMRATVSARRAGWRTTMSLDGLSPPGVVVNHLKGDPEERRVNTWLEGTAGDGLDVALFGVPFDGASTVRTGARHGPDAVRQALCYHTTYSSETGLDMASMGAADVGDVPVVVTDMRGTFERVAATSRELVERGIKFACIGGDHSITWPLLDGVTGALEGKRLGVVHFDARDVQYALREIGAHPKTIAMDVVEISPPLDVNNMTGNLGAMLVLSFFMGIASAHASLKAAR